MIQLYGVGGSTVKKRHQDDLGAVSALKPDIIILENAQESVSFLPVLRRKSFVAILLCVKLK